MKDFVTMNRGNIPEGKAAVIVKPDQKGLILIYELITFELPIVMQIFEDFSTGLDWVKQ